jgi:hypothetical protein
MKKLIIAVLAALSFFNANAFTSGIRDVQPKGGFNLGVQIGVPPVGDWDADMPMVSVDGNWVLASGMFDAGKFGRNGAIDLGFYAGTCVYDKYKPHYYKNNTPYYKDANGTLFHDGLWQNCILVRSAFHFEFVPKFDVYAGIFTGVNIWSPTGDSDWNTDTKLCVGPFIGCKYFFTNHFGLKAEFGDDFNEGNYPNASFGLAFKFK